MLRLRFKPGFDRLASWGKPDAPRRPLCGYCHGKLPQVPLILWRSNGASISLCDPCVETWIEVDVLNERTPRG